MGEKELTLENEKQQEWEKIIMQVEAATDGLGHPVERGIEQAVIGLNAFGLNTSSSCEGHTTGWGRITPWVGIRAPAMPDDHFMGEKEITRSVYEKNGITEDFIKRYNAVSQEIQDAIVGMQVSDIKRGSAEFTTEIRRIAEEARKKYGISADDSRKYAEARGLAQDALSEALKSGTISGEWTPEFEQWTERNKELWEKAHDLVAEFNLGRNIPEEIRLSLEKNWRMGFAIYTGTEDYSMGAKSPNKGKIISAEKLAQYQKEMNDFATFLKNKFLG